MGDGVVCLASVKCPWTCQVDQGQLLVNYIVVNVGYVTVLLPKIMARSIFNPLILFHVPCEAVNSFFNLHFLNTSLD